MDFASAFCFYQFLLYELAYTNRLDRSDEICIQVSVLKEHSDVIVDKVTAANTAALKEASDTIVHKATAANTAALKEASDTIVDKVTNQIVDGSGISRSSVSSSDNGISQEGDAGAGWGDGPICRA